MSISQSVSGYGTSGVVTATMTFVTPCRPHGSGIAIDTYDIRQNAEVKLVCDDIAIVPPLFYVTGRKKSGGMTEWTCCDLVSKSDKLLEFTDNDFDENDKISVSDMLVKIHDQCGIGVNADGLLFIDRNTQFDKSLCENGITARRILEIFAEAMCGFWFSIDNKIAFANLGRTMFAAIPTVYKAVDLNGSRVFSKIICTDDDAVYIAGAGDAANTIVCSTDFASQELADYIFGALIGSSEDEKYTYRSWSCSKGRADHWYYPGAYQFGETMLTCNNVSMSVSASGLFFTASANAIDEDEAGYTSEVNRQLKRKLEFDKINGNVAITNKGLYLFENGYKSKTPEEQKKAKYGFKVEKGVTEYDGALVSNVVPSSATWNADKTEAIVDYGGKKYKYKVVKDAKGNVTSFTKEGVKEETK